MSETLDVVVFTCEGREHLLRKTWESFGPRLEKAVRRRILAVDGQIADEAIAAVQPDVVVQNYRRRGYVQSMLNAISLVDTKLFLWLEDDWEITGEFNLEQAVDALNQNPGWVQVRWSQKPTLDEGDHPLTPGIHFSSVGFSANPCLCRTVLVKQGLQQMADGPRRNSLADGFFENVLINWARNGNLVCAVFDPRGQAAVTHLGLLESTGRQWLMTASLNQAPRQHFFNMGRTRPQLWRRAWMACKLLRWVLSIILGMFRRDVAYELAHRIIVTTKVALGPECSSEGRVTLADPQR